MNLSIRLSTNDDLSFIHNSWLRTAKQTYPNQYALDFSKYYSLYMQALLKNSITAVIHLSDDPNELIGYLVYGSFRHMQIIHMAYVKGDARKQGALKQLLQFSNPQQSPIVFTTAAHDPKLMEKLSARYIYDPNIISVMDLT